MLIYIDFVLFYGHAGGQMVVGTDFHACEKTKSAVASITLETADF